MSDSLKMRRWIWLVWSENGPGHVVQRAIAQVLFDFFMTTGKVFPSERTIAEKIGASERTTRRHIQALEAGGWIKRRFIGTDRGQGWRRTEYTLAWPKNRQPDTDLWLREVEENRKSARAEFRAENDWADDDPIESGYNYDVPEAVDQGAWRAYLAHRKRMDRPMSVKAVEQSGQRLRKLSAEDQRTCVQHSIESGQVGLQHQIFIR